MSLCVCIGVDVWDFAYSYFHTLCVCAYVCSSPAWLLPSKRTVRPKSVETWRKREFMAMFRPCLGLRGGTTLSPLTYRQTDIAQEDIGKCIFFICIHDISKISTMMSILHYRVHVWCGVECSLSQSCFLQRAWKSFRIYSSNYIWHKNNRFKKTYHPVRKQNQGYVRSV